MNIIPMTIRDYVEVRQLWESCQGIDLHDWEDSKEGIACYLERNSGLSVVAINKNQLIGAVPAGHDGRRGYLHHLAVVPEYRGNSVGKALVKHVLSALSEVGINKCHIFVMNDNIIGHTFWKQIGWSGRNDLVIMSKNIITNSKQEILK